MNKDYFEVINNIRVAFENYSYINYMLNTLRGLAVIFIVIQLLIKFMKGVHEKQVFSPADIVRPIVLVGLLASYSLFMDKTELVLAAFEKDIISQVNNEGNIKAELVKQKGGNLEKGKEGDGDGELKPDATQYPEDFSLWNLATIKQMVTNPTTIFIRFFNLLGDLLSSCVYVSALLIRAFMLFALKLLGPIVIMLSIWDKFHNAMWNWVRLYAVYFLWIIPMFIGETFVDFVQRESFWGADSSTFLVGEDNYQSLTYALIISMCALFVKFVIMKSTLETLKQIFLNSDGK